MLRALGLRRGPRPLSKEYVAAIHNRCGLRPDEPAPTPTVQMWLDFALSSAERGRAAVGLLGGRQAVKGKRVLDVGCAYGGFLVAAAEAGARRVVGIDIDEGLLDLARLQLERHRRRSELLQLDVTAPDPQRRLGTFDVILCNDVLEHVSDPFACAVNLAALLDGGGRMLLQIPNGQAVDFMLSDGHYGLFGITLLDRARAERLWARTYTDTYGVEHYAPLSYYLDVFSQAGISLRLLGSPPDDLHALVDDLDGRFTELEQTLAALGDDELEREMKRRGGHEIVSFRHLAARFRESPIEAERAIHGRTLWSTYGLTFWELVGRKEAS